MTPTATRTQCPYCNKRLRFRGRPAAQQVTCPACTLSFKLEAPEEPGLPPLGPRPATARVDEWGEPVMSRWSQLPQRSARTPADILKEHPRTVAVAFVVLALIFLIGTVMPSGKGDKYGAEAAAHSFVRARLKAPSTADFSDDLTFANNDGSYVVSGAVDAQNSYGTMIRTRYVCTVEPKATGGWRLVSLTIGGTDHG